MAVLLKSGLLLCSLCLLMVLTADKTKKDSCTENGMIQLDSNDTCGTVKGKLQICENLFWETLCDSAWTLQDARVACRSLGYLSEGEFSLSRASLAWQKSETLLYSRSSQFPKNADLSGKHSWSELHWVRTEHLRMHQEYGNCRWDL